MSLEDDLRSAREAASPSDHGEGLAMLRRELLGGAAGAHGSHASDAVGAGDRAVEEVDAAQSGAFVGRFELRRTLGRGAMGVVYEAWDPQLARVVALKLVLPQVAQRPGGIARLRREARAMAALQHANVVQVYDVGEHGGRAFIAMEHAAGGTLASWLETPAGWQEVLTALLQAAHGLLAAHRAGLVHRDIKPSNILQTSAGVFKVADFGLVSARGAGRGGDSDNDGNNHRDGGQCGDGDDGGGNGNRSSSGAGISDGDDGLRTRGRVGTPAYMAPEVWSGAAPSALSDQYSFCLVLYEALYGARPFGGRPVALSPPASTRAGARCPRGLRDALARGLAIDPTARFADMGALIGALEASLNRGRASGRRGWPAVAASVGLVGLICAGALGLVGLLGQARDAGVEARTSAALEPHPRQTWAPAIDFGGWGARLHRAGIDFEAAASSRATLLDVMRKADADDGSAGFPDLPLAFERKPALRARWFRARHAFEAALAGPVLGRLPTHALSHGEQTHPFVQLNLAAAQLELAGLPLDAAQRERARALGEDYERRARALTARQQGETLLQRKLLDEAELKHEVDVAFRGGLDGPQRAALVLHGAEHVLSWDLYGVAELLAQLVRPIGLGHSGRGDLAGALLAAGVELLEAPVDTNALEPVLRGMAGRVESRILPMRGGQLRITVDDALAFGRSMAQTRTELLELLPAEHGAAPVLRSGGGIPVFYLRGARAFAPVPASAK